MSKISLNFFGETFSVERTNNLSSLRNEISKLLCLNPEDANEIIMTYKDEEGDKTMISNDEDLNIFLNSKSTTIDLDISQQSQIYKENLNQLQEETLKDKSTLEELLKKNNELENLKTTKFISENKEIESINLQIEELIKKQKELNIKKNELENKILAGIEQINQEQSYNDIKIAELQKKLGIPVAEKKKPKKTLFDDRINHSVFRYPFGAKDNFGNNIFESQEEKENKLNENFKNLSLNPKEEEEEDLKENEKERNDKKIKRKKEEVHYTIICDGCDMEPIVGKRYKCKKCRNFDYCEKCYEKRKNSHPPHEFQLIEKSEFKKPTSPQRSFFNFGNFGHFGNFGPHFPFFHQHHHYNRKRRRFDDRPNINNTTFPNQIYKNIHFGVECCGCGCTPIMGARYKCSVCEKVDFCEQCEKKYGENHGHPLIKI